MTARREELLDGAYAYVGRMDERTRALLPSLELKLAEYGIEFVISHVREITAG